MPCSRSEEHTSELQSLRHLVCRLLLEQKDKREKDNTCARKGIHPPAPNGPTPLPPMRTATPETPTMKGEMMGQMCCVHPFFLSEPPTAGTYPFPHRAALPI